MRRTVLALPILLASVAPAQIVINEMDYDQVSTDNAEFIEIKNIGLDIWPMSDVSVVMYNGSTGVADEYRTIMDATWPDLQPGDYFVICGNASLTQNCDHGATPLTNLIQNGPLDAVALVRTSNSDVLDVVSYGGSLEGVVEGTGTTAEDTNLNDGVSIGRDPDGNDTNNNDADFFLMCSTPGAENVIDPSACDLSTGVVETTINADLIIRPAVNGNGLVLSVAGSSSSVQFDVFAIDGSLVHTRSSASTANNVWTLSLPERSGQVLLVRAIGDGFSVTQKVMMP